MEQNNVNDNLVNIHYFDNVEDAQRESTALATNTFGQVCPVIMFQQGNRTCASTSIPVKIAIQILSTNPVDKRANLDSVRQSFNRPIDKDHVKSVSSYIQNSIYEKNKYILPSLTVTAIKQQHIYTVTPLSNNFTQVGYLVVSLDDKSLIVTDGQHRLEGLKKAINELEGEDKELLKSDGLPIMFSFESDMNQVHQDFADCSKTKALPKSMIAVYDRRVPANGLILDIIEKSNLFSDGRTDSTSVSLSKKSNCLVLTNSVRNIMKALFTGNHSMADKAFDAFANKNLSDKNSYQQYLDRATLAIDSMTISSPILNAISKISRGPERQKIVEYREKYLIANPLGLSLACKAIYQYSLFNQTGLDIFIDRLMNDIDWKKSSHIWNGNVINEKDGKFAISSTNKSVSAALEKIEQQLGVSLDPQAELI